MVGGSWRIIAIISLIVAAVVLFGRFDFPSNHIARVEIEGIIFEDNTRDNLLADLAEDDNVRAVIVHINSPGGTIAGSEEIYDGLRQIAKNKPVVAVMGGFATSGGYIAALGADYIFARQMTITGSIGVLFQWFDAVDLAKKIGIKSHVIRSGDLKARPDVFEKPAQKTIHHIERVIIKEGFDWFINLVVSRRGLDKDDLLKIVGDGRVFTGKQAVGYRLVDRLGSAREARDWLISEHSIDVGLPIKDRKPADPDWRWYDWIFDRAALLAGVDLRQAAQQGGLKAAMGLMAIWRP